MNELSLFDSFFDNVWANTPRVMYTTSTSPKVDVKEDKNSYSLEMELPGRDEKDVNIELKDDTLTIRSKKDDVKEDKKEDKNGKYILKERHFSSFERRFALPSDVNQDDISASFKNGILTVNMLKKPIESPKRIEIAAC